jgi:hypothetical protein
MFTITTNTLIIFFLGITQDIFCNAIECKLILNLLFLHNSQMEIEFQEPAALKLSLLNSINSIK